MSFPQPGDPQQPPSSGGSDSHADAPTRVSDSSVNAEQRPVGPVERPSIEGYELIEEVHRGGQGVVFRATQHGTRRQVAIKVLLEGPFASATARRRFEREIELAASLRHPSIVTILESGVSRGRYFFAMDYIEGQRLDAYLRETRPGLEATLDLFVRIADTVNHAHQRGVIHRDLKPSNILIAPDGHPHVLDFGLAKSAASEADPDRTTMKVLSTTGQVVGTLAYMSPEQARGAQDVDVRSDVYALGVILYEALLGRMPYDVSGPLGDILNRIAVEEPHRPRQARNSSRFGRMIDDEMETILLKSLEKEPERRYQTAGSLARDLTRYLNNEPIIAKPASGLYMLRKLLKRYQLQAVAAATVLSTLLVCMVILIFQYRGEVILRQNYAAAENRATQAAEAAQQNARIAEDAERRERVARRKAEANASAIELANQQLQQALLQQVIQRGELARLNGDLAVARDSYWEAYLSDDEQAATRWALRQYYFESGDERAVQLSLHPAPQIAISPDGRLAAVGGRLPGIRVISIDTGKPIRWLATPGPVEAIRIDDRGVVAAGGGDWLDIWDAETLRSTGHFATNLPGGLVDLAFLPDMSALYVVSGDTVQLFGVAAEEPLGRTRLNGTPTGSALLRPDTSELWIPTTSGLERVRRSASNQIEAEVLWSRGAIRSLAAVGESLVVLGDAVYRGTFTDEPDFERLFTLRETYDLLAAAPDGTTFAVASRGGRVLTVRDGRRDRIWQITRERLQTLQWDESGLLTLDGSGTLTRWTNPERNAQQTRIDRRVPQRWDVAQDGSTAMLLDNKGRLSLYQRGQDRAQDIRMPGVLQRFTGRSVDNVMFALDESGASALMLDGRRLWLYNTESQTARALRWRLPRGATVKLLDLSWDGARTAFYTQSASEDRQYIAVRSIRDNGTSGNWTYFDLAGSGVQTMTFLPRSHLLLVARSNGNLLLLDPDAPRDSSREVPAPWLVIDAPVRQMAFSDLATHLALACDDGRIRVIDPATGEETASVRDVRPVTSLDFDPSGNVLLVRFADGQIEMFDFRRMTRILRWNANPGAAALTSWLSPSELLLTDGAGVLRLGFDATDEKTRDNLGFALVREVTRSIAAGDPNEAWRTCDRLDGHSEPLAEQTRHELLEIALSNPRHDLRGSEEAVLQRTLDPTVRRRLGHAAYQGGRFELADRLLRGPVGAHVVDTYTALRMAQCDYLLERYGAAAAAFSNLLKTEPPGSETARIQLQLLAAHVMDGDLEAARQSFAGFQQSPGRRTGRNERDAMGQMATRVIGNLLLGNEADSQVSSTFRNLLTVFKTQWLDYRDDIEFFAGELERQRGQFAAAEIRYQRCLELARDAWPANWARLRLDQMSRKTE